MVTLSTGTETAAKQGPRVKLLDRGVYVLASPRADVYFAHRTHDGSLGTAVFVGSLVRGDVCAGIGGSDQRGAFLLKARTGIRLNPLKNERREPERAQTTLRRWIAALNAAPRRGMRPQVFREAPYGTSMALDAGSAIGSGARYTWLLLEDADGYLFGRRSDIAVVNEGPWPLAPHEWIIVRSAGAARGLDTEEVVQNGLMIGALLRHAGKIASLLDQDHQHQRQVEMRRISARMTLDSVLIRSSASKLAALLEPDAESAVAADPLNAAIERVATSQGISLCTVAQPNRRPMVQLRTAARANGFRLRRITLRGSWWTREGPPMLGSVLRNAGTKPLPVALLPDASGRGYAVWDPEKAQERRLDVETAAEFRPFGYAFYRPMPSDPWRPWALFSFGMHGCRRDVWILLALGIAAGGLAALVPVLTGTVYDLAIPEADRTQLRHLTALIVSLGISAALFQVVRAMAVLRIETRLDDSLQAGVWDHLLALPARFFRNYTAGDLAARAGGIGMIRHLTSGAATGGILTGIFACWYLGLLLYYDVRLAAWAILFLAVATGVSLLLALLQLKHQRKATHIQSRLAGLVLQLVTGIAKIRVAGAEVRAFARWADRFAAQRRASVMGQRYANFIAAVQAVVPLSLLAITYALAVGDGTEMSTGEFLAFQTALLAFAAASAQVTAIFAAAATAVPLYEQLRPILTCRRESDVERTDPGEIMGDVEIRRVSFGYSDDGPRVLSDVSLHARPGEFIALVGPSGSGKSSVLRLLLGFESPASGAVYYDGQELAGLNLHALRRQLGVVLQEAGLLTGDLYTNIAGSTEATMDDAWEAARMAGLADEIRAMPMGMHTVLNQNGTTISGGQRQRLMIARAVVHRPRILLFDEATSALDNVTQEQVSRSLATLQATRIVVAHRLSTIVNADRIYVLDRGRVVEEGRYDELVRAGGIFGKLSRRQMMETGNHV